MFEDSTFESAKRIKTKSGRYMLLTGGINCAVLLLFISGLLRRAPTKIHVNGPDAATAASTTTAAAAA